MLALLLVLLWQSGTAQQHAKKGYELAQKGDWKAAEAEFRQAVRLAPADPASLAYLGMVLARQEKLAEANTYFESALKIDPGDSGTRYNLAVNQWRLGRPEAARANLERLLKLKPGHVQGTFLLGKIAAELGDLEAAERLFASIRESYPDRAAAGYELALVQYRAGRFADSRSTLLWTLAGAPKDARLFRLLAWTYQREGRAIEATEIMRQAISLDPAAEAGYAELGMILLEQKRHTDAYDVAMKGIAQAPKSAACHRVKGLAQASLNSFRQALESFRRATELDPNDAEALLLVAETQANLWMIPEASATYEKGMARFPKHARLLESYGRMLLDRAASPDAGAESRAQALFEKALALDDSLAGAQHELGELLLRKGKAADALPHLEAAVRLRPRSSQFWLTLANAHKELGRAEEHRKAIEAYRTLQAQGEQAKPD